MNNDTAPPTALLDQLIATLLAVFGVPVRFALAVLQACATVKGRFAEALRICEAEGWALRYEGEDDALVAARVKFIAWIARDPWAARRRMVRGMRGWEAHRFASYVPVLCLPPWVMGAGVASTRACASPPTDTS